MAKAWKASWEALCRCRRGENLPFFDASSDYEFDDDMQEAKELTESKRKKKMLPKRKKKKGGDYYSRDQEVNSSSSAEEYFDSPPQYPPWVWQTMGMEDPLGMYAVQPGTEQQAFYVDPGNVGEQE